MRKIDQQLAPVLVLADYAVGRRELPTWLVLDRKKGNDPKYVVLKGKRQIGVRFHVISRRFLQD
jgi:hypothetical protein